jgi:hypothetical protein
MMMCGAAYIFKPVRYYYGNSSVMGAKVDIHSVYVALCAGIRIRNIILLLGTI